MSGMAFGCAQTAPCRQNKTLRTISPRTAQPVRRLLLLCFSTCYSCQAGQFAQVLLNGRAFGDGTGGRVEKLPDTRIRARFEGVLILNGYERTLVQHRDAIGDAECARYLMGHN